MKLFHVSFLVFFCLLTCCGSDEYANKAITSEKEQSTVQYANSFDVPEASVMLSGTIGKVSALPDPAKAPYEDCLFSAEFFSQEKDFLKTILLFPGFKDRVLFPESELIKQGISIRIHAVPFDDLSEEMQIIQQADDLNDIDSEIFYVKSFEIIDEIKGSSQRIHRAEVTITPPERDVQADEIRANRIKDELQRIEKIVEDNGGFEEWRKKAIYRELKDQKEQRTINDVLFSWKEGCLKRFASGYPKENAVAGLQALNSFLLKKGIHLIVLFWPAPEEVVADLFFPEAIEKEQYLDVTRVQLMQELLKQNVETVDLLPPLKENRFRYPPLLFQAHLYDEHPSSGATRIAGETVSEILKRYSKKEENPKDIYSLIEIPMAEGRNYMDFKETAVSLNGKSYSFVDDADILFAGDSFCYHPQIPSSVGAFCGYYSKKRNALIARSGGAQRMFRSLLQAHQKTGLLNKKKVIVLSVIPSHLKVGWEIPVGYPDFKAETYEIRKTLSPQNQFSGVSAKWSVSGTPIDFSTGSISLDERPSSRDKIVLTLPDSEGVQEGILSVSTKSSAYYELTFLDSDNQVFYTGGGLRHFNNGEEEMLIPFKTGRNMQLIFSPSNITVMEIKYMKQIE